MMHVLCEEYETVYAACLLITTAVLGVDFGYQPTDQGQLEYIIQIEPEAIEKLKAGEAIQVGLPPNVQRVQVFRVQVGDAELPKILPTSYEEPVNQRTNEIGLMPTESPKLTAPPESTSAADTKPALGEELAQYIPRQTRTLPSGATEPAPTNSTLNNTTASGTTRPPIPGAEERYGGASSTGSRFSVPATPGSPYSAVQTSGTTPLGSNPTPTTSGATGNSTTGSQYNSAANSTTTPTPNSGTTVGGTNWSATSQNGTGTTATNQQNSGTSTATNPYRFNQSGSTTNQGAPDLISPSDSNNWVSNNGQTNTGSTYSGNQTNQGTGQTGGTMSPPNNNGGYIYPGTGGTQQQQQPGNTNPPSNGSNSENPWLTGAWNNQTNGNTAPYSPMPGNTQNTGQPNTQQPPYNNQQPPAGYNNQQQQPYGGNFVNNNYGQQPPYYGTNPNYPYNNQQPPYYQGAYGQQPVAQVAWNTPAGTAPPAQQQQPQTTTTASVSDTDKEKEIVEKVVEKEVETLPSWWPFLAFGFLLSFCANGYMFIISQDFQRKYQDLLEDVRDLRTMSND